MARTARSPNRRRGPFRWSLIPLAVLLLGSGCAYFNTFYHAKKFYGEAAKAQQNEERQNAPSGSGASSGLYKKAIEKCEKVIQDYPGSKWQDDAYLLLAKSHYGRGDYIAAQQAVSTLLESFPESNLRSEGIHWQGRIQFADEDYTQAREIWSGLLEEFPDFDHREEVEYFLARAVWLGGDPDGAITNYGTFLKRYPKGNYSAGARLDLGELLVEEKRYPEAETVFTAVSKGGKSESDRIEGKIRLGEVLELEGRNEDARELYARLEVDLDPDILKGRMTVQERQDLEAEQRAALEAARADSIRRAKAQNPEDPTGSLDGDLLVPQNNPAAAGLGSQRGTAPGALNRRDINDPVQKQLARVMLREGAVLAKLDRAEDALLVYEQVVSEFPQSPFAAEAQYRLGYTYEVHLEEFDRAQAAYDGVARHGNSSFREDAQRRSKNLITLRGLMHAAAKDSLSQAEASAAEAKFMRAELYLFQQESIEKAIEEYRNIETEFAGGEYAAKAGLALAWITQNSLGDSLGAMAKYAEVAGAFPDTEYGRRASLIAFGPPPDPEPIDFAGPSVEELTAPENLAVAQANLLAEEAADSLNQGPPMPGDLPSSGGRTAPGIAAAGTQLAETAPGASIPVPSPVPSGPTAAGLGAAGAAAGAGASLSDMVEATHRQAEAAAAGTSPEVNAAAEPSPEVTAAQAGDGAGAVPEVTEAPDPGAGELSTSAATEAGIVAAGEAAASGVAELPAPTVGDPPIPGGQAAAPAARPDSTARAMSVPADLYLDPLAVPADGPTPVAAPTAPEAGSEAPRKPPRDKAPASKEAPADDGKSSKSADDSSKNDSGPSDSKSKEEPVKKDEDSPKDAAPDSTSGKGSS